MEEAKKEAKQLMEEAKQLASVADRVVSVHLHCAYQPGQCPGLCLWLSKELEFISSNQEIASYYTAGCYNIIGFNLISSDFEYNFIAVLYHTCTVYIVLM